MLFPFFLKSRFQLVLLLRNIFGSFLVKQSVLDPELDSNLYVCLRIAFFQSKTSPSEYPEVYNGVNACRTHYKNQFSLDYHEFFTMSCVNRIFPLKTFGLFLKHIPMYAFNYSVHDWANICPSLYHLQSYPKTLHKLR